MGYVAVDDDILKGLNTCYQTFNERNFKVFGNLVWATKLEWFRPPNPVCKWSVKSIRKDKFKTLIGA